MLLSTTKIYHHLFLIDDAPEAEKYGGSYQENMNHLYRVINLQGSNKMMTKRSLHSAMTICRITKIHWFIYNHQQLDWDVAVNNYPVNNPTWSSAFAVSDLCVFNSNEV